MTLAACPLCGTQADPGAACFSCGTPVPVERPADGGQAVYWEKVRVRLEQVVRPRYELRALLGYGGMAGVFAADEPRLGRSVALKVMSPALMMDPQLVERFAQEARTIALLNHPNIITIYEVDEREDLHWFVMAFVAGRTLADVMTDASAPLAIEVVRAWLYQVCDALSYAHGRGVVHRDIKPGNVLLAPRGDALVTDFGIAKVADAGTGLTRTGTLVGTPTYMSPEQCTSSAVTGASDQYSLGAVVYQMLTGAPPFTGPTMSVLQAHVAQVPVPIRELRPDCPEELAATVERMLEKRPEDRHPDMSAVITASGATPPGVSGALRAQLEEHAALAVSVEVVPSPAALREGSRERLRATILGIGARPLRGRLVYWSSTAPTVAVVSAGQLNAFSSGTAEIGAASGAASRSFTVEVAADPVGGVAMLPGPRAVDIGGTIPLEAVALDLDGTTLDGRALLWSSSDPQVARVSTEGMVYGVAVGEVIIGAHTGGKRALVRVTVKSAAAAVPPVASAQARTPVRREVGEVAAQARTPVRREVAEVPAPASTPVPGDAGEMPSSAAAEVASPPSSPLLERAPAALARAATLLRRPAVLAGAVLLVVGAAAGAGLGPWLLGRESRAAAEGDAAAPVPVDGGQGTARGATIPLAAGAGPAGAAVAAEPPGAADAGPAHDVASAEERTALEPPGPAGGERRATSVSPTGAQPPRAAAPASGSLAVVPGLPADASVVARDSLGRGWNLTDRQVTLPAGTYAIQFRAAGYEPEDTVVVLGSAAQYTWRPQARRLAAPEPARPAIAPPESRLPAASAPIHDLEANRQDVARAVRAWVAAFSARQAETVLPLLPAGERSKWEEFFKNRDISSFTASLTDLLPASITGDSGSIQFAVAVEYRNDGQTKRSTLRFTGQAARGTSGWQLVSLK